MPGYRSGYTGPVFERHPNEAAALFEGVDKELQLNAANGGIEAGGWLHAEDAAGLDAGTYEERRLTVDG